MRRLSRQEVRELAELGAIFVAIGFFFGLLGGEPLLGMVAGVLLFAMVVIVGGLPMLF